MNTIPTHATPQPMVTQQEQQNLLASHINASHEVKYFDILTSMLTLAQEFVPPVRIPTDRE